MAETQAQCSFERNNDKKLIFKPICWSRADLLKRSKFCIHEIGIKECTNIEAVHDETLGRK